jgi:hypothetical protein
MGRTPARPETHGLGLSDDVWKMVQECWRKRPDQRPTIHSILERLGAALTFPSQSNYVGFDDSSEKNYHYTHESSSSTVLHQLVELQSSPRQLVPFLNSLLSESSYPRLHSALHGDESLQFIDIIDQVSVHWKKLKKEMS